MSKVYFAVNSLNDPFAIKLLDNGLFTNEALRKRFRNEMEALKSLRDIEQVCQIKDFYEDAHQMAIVMEYLTGIDLLKYIRQNGPIAPAELIRWMQELLPAFATCHARKIVHRDVKPSNFFLTDAGKLKILDFGIAKALDQTEAHLNSMARGLTLAQEVIGSPMYMSPEQVRGLQQIDHRSDIYSLGVMMYTLLVGRNPYENLSSQSNYDVQEAVVKNPLPDLTDKLAVFNPIIQKATQKEPGDRYQSVQELQAHLDSISLTTRPATPAGEAATRLIKPPTPPRSRISQAAVPVSASIKAKPTSVSPGRKVILSLALLAAGVTVGGIYWQTRSTIHPRPHRVSCPNRCTACCG